MHRIALVVTGGLACVVAYLTLTPAPTLTIGGGDKLHHFVAFAALSLPAATLYRRALPWLLPCIIAFGGAIEIIQPHVNRHGEWGDFWADTVGALLGVAIGFVLRRWVRPAPETTH